MSEIVGACLSQFHDDENSFELLLAYSDGREVGFSVSRKVAQKVALELANGAGCDQSAVEREAEPVAWLFEGDGWGREVMLSHQEALDRKERLSRTWDIEITPLYAAPVSTPPAAAVRVTDEMVAAYKAAYRQHTDACILGFIPPQTDGIIIEATRRGIAAALSASPSPPAVPVRGEGEAAGVAEAGKCHWCGGTGHHPDKCDWVTESEVAEEKAGRARAAASPSPVDSRDGLIERLVKALDAAETYVIDGVTTAKQNLEMNAAYPARKTRYEAELQEARDIYAECQAARRLALAAKEQQP